MSDILEEWLEGHLGIALAEELRMAQQKGYWKGRARQCRETLDRIREAVDDTPDSRGRTG